MRLIQFAIESQLSLTKSFSKEEYMMTLDICDMPPELAKEILHLKTNFSGISIWLWKPPKVS